MKKTALFWEKQGNGVQCNLCPNFCLLAEGQAGKCQKRVNKNSTLFAENYAQTISLQLDPMRKKPLYHFYPDDSILSLGANSCNLSCLFCQNYSSSQVLCDTLLLPPDALLNYCQQNKIRHVAFTYTEPFTWFEYIYDSALLLQEAGISVVLVTNGYVNPEPLQLLLPHVSAMNIDLKAFSESFYADVCGGKLQPVLDTIAMTHNKAHIEITLLLIETLNDNPADLEEMFSFISSLNPDIPLHISRYFPRYKMLLPTTSINLLHTTAKLAKRYLNYVYLGNV